MFDLNEQHDVGVDFDDAYDVESTDSPAGEASEVSEEASKEPKKLKIRKSKPTEDADTQNQSKGGVASQNEKDENYVPGEKKDWYILKVQVNREDAIKESIKRRVAIAGLDVYFGDILVPTEKVTEFRAGKKRIVKKKLYPGYIMVFMEITEETWFLVRETPGIGDFTGAAGKPTPMLPHEVQRILLSEKADTEDSPKLKIGYQVGDKIKVKDGTFENFEGEVHQIDTSNGRVTVMINIFGRSTPVELEYWQIETPN
ncbi:MAG: transcription termination/antitermination protein NusG [Thermoguttaceae bacterium]